MPLYLIATPIGNLEDITLRALRLLREVRLIAAEDTRTTGRLLAHYEIETPLLSYHEYSTPARLATLVDRLREGDVALVSDAGTPGLSDPGYRLVRAALDAGISVVPIPGPSAVTTALVASGLPTDGFLFLGFLPRRQGGRRQALRAVASLPYTLVLYEAPHRVLALLADVEAVLGDRAVCVARELTKLHEEIWRGSVREARAHFAGEEGQVRGEFTVVIGGHAGEEAMWDEARVRQALAEQMANGLSHSEAAAQVAEAAGWRKRDVYSLAKKP